MNDLIEEFRNNRLWIHIKEDDSLLDALIEAMPGFEFGSGDKWGRKTIDSILKMNHEAWFRCDKHGISYNSRFPRTSGCRNVSPWIYDNGPIVEVNDILYYETYEINENDIMKIIS